MIESMDRENKLQELKGLLLRVAEIGDWRTINGVKYLFLADRSQQKGDRWQQVFYRLMAFVLLGKVI